MNGLLCIVFDNHHFVLDSSIASSEYLLDAVLFYLQAKAYLPLKSTYVPLSKLYIPEYSSSI